MKLIKPLMISLALLLVLSGCTKKSTVADYKTLKDKDKIITQLEEKVRNLESERALLQLSSTKQLMLWYEAEIIALANPESDDYWALFEVQDLEEQNRLFLSVEDFKDLNLEKGQTVILELTIDTQNLQSQGFVLTDIQIPKSSHE